MATGQKDSRGLGYVIPVVAAATLSFGLPTGCSDDDGGDIDAGGDAVVADTLASDGDAGMRTVEWTVGAVEFDDSSCTKAATDFTPGDATDDWAACIADDNAAKYPRFEDNISTIARVAAFEQIRQLLLKGTPPTKQDFIDARLAYSQAEGLDSRVSRREDEHVPAASKACADMNESEIAANSERCVGQAQMQPMLNQAFADGIEGKNPLENAARIEATLLWFFYVSTYKEAVTCRDKKRDCDSSYAYYTGGEPRGSGLGLSGYLRSVGQGASQIWHDRVWDGVLATRCWRDLDDQTPPTDAARHEQALGQLDRALDRGLAVVVQARLDAIEAATNSATRDTLWITVQILGGALDRAMRKSDAAEADALKQDLQKSLAEASFDTIREALNTALACP